MDNRPHVTAELTFLRTAEGGRMQPPQPPWGQYMPHAVVEGLSEYLGVRFTSGPAVVVAGEPDWFDLSLMYHPEVDYAALQPGAAITIREGGRVVARGWVLERRELMPASGATHPEQSAAPD